MTNKIDRLSRPLRAWLVFAPLALMVGCSHVGDRGTDARSSGAGGGLLAASSGSSDGSSGYNGAIAKDVELRVNSSAERESEAPLIFALFAGTEEAQRPVPPFPPYVLVQLVFDTATT